jgi:hypothetical protein
MNGQGDLQRKELERRRALARAALRGTGKA